MFMTQHNAVARTGKLSVPEHMRSHMTFFQHGAKLQILEENVGGNPNRVKVQIQGHELDIEKRFVDES